MRLLFVISKQWEVVMKRASPSSPGVSPQRWVVLAAGAVMLMQSGAVALDQQAALAPDRKQGLKREAAAGGKGDAAASPESKEPGSGKSSLCIAGTVTDASTGKAIDGFRIVPILYFAPDRPFVLRNRFAAEARVKREGPGKFTVTVNTADKDVGMQVEAHGYKTARSVDCYRLGDPDATLAFSLEPAKLYLGRVLDGRGHPVADARIYIATSFQHLQLRNLQDEGGTVISSNYCVKSDNEGRFEIFSQIERYAVVVICPNGYAEVERPAERAPGDIRIEKWASVQGKLIHAGNPVSKWVVSLRQIRDRGADDPQISCLIYGKTGEDGSFTFKRVPPTPCHVKGELHFARDSPLTSSQSLPLPPTPGETMQVVLGGGGSEVTGMLVADGAPEDFDYHFSWTYLVAKRPGIAPPSWLVAKGFDPGKVWSDSWRRTREGQAYLETLHHFYVKPEPDGRFRISGVSTGEYDFAIALYGGTSNEGCLLHPAASRVLRVSVDGRQPELDLGKIAVPSLNVPQVGDPVPEFEFEDAAGRRSSLASLRGKYVLLDFWATWCAPCVARMDEVERIRRAQPDLVVVGVNLDADERQANAFLKRKSLPWRHVLLGDWSNTDVPKRFAVAALPTYVLITPGGRIDVHGESLEAVAAKLPRADR